MPQGVLGSFTANVGFISTLLSGCQCVLGGSEMLLSMLLCGY